MECHQAEYDLWIVLTDKVNVGLELAESAVPSCRDRETPSSSPGGGSTLPGWRPSQIGEEGPSKGKAITSTLDLYTGQESIMTAEVDRKALEDVDGSKDTSLLFERSEGEPRSTRVGCMKIAMEFRLEQHHPEEDEPEVAHMDLEHGQASMEVVGVLGDDPRGFCWAQV